MTFICTVEEKTDITHPFVLHFGFLIMWHCEGTFFFFLIGPFGKHVTFLATLKTVETDGRTHSEGT